MQDVEDFSTGRGETLEQYAAYQEYIIELERHFDAFAQVRPILMTASKTKTKTNSFSFLLFNGPYG